MQEKKTSFCGKEGEKYRTITILFSFLSTQQKSKSSVSDPSVISQTARIRSQTNIFRVESLKRLDTGKTALSVVYKH